MIDDFSISGVNDSRESRTSWMSTWSTLSAPWSSFTSVLACLMAGTPASWQRRYDLKSAYRQVPVKPEHYQFSYFSVYNHKRQCAEIYRLKTMPFGATHSVYCFLRLARMLYAMATRSLFLVRTNFYDDFMLVSKPPWHLFHAAAWN